MRPVDQELKAWPWSYTLSDMNAATIRGQYVVERAREIVLDTHCAGREAELQCAPCHQLSRERVLREYMFVCIRCQDRVTGPEAMQPVLCRTCAQSCIACRHCAADRDLQHRDDLVVADAR